MFLNFGTQPLGSQRLVHRYCAVALLVVVCGVNVFGQTGDFQLKEHAGGVQIVHAGKVVADYLTKKRQQANCMAAHRTNRCENDS